MLTRRKTRSSTGAADPAAVHDDSVAAAAAAAAGDNGKSRRGKVGAFGNRARNAANRTAAADAKQDGGGAGSGKGGAKRGRSSAASAAATAAAAAAASSSTTTATAGAKRTTRSKSNGRALASAAAAAVTGKKRKAVKSEPEDEDEEETAVVDSIAGPKAAAAAEDSKANPNKRTKKERRGSSASGSSSSDSDFAAAPPAPAITHLTTASPSSRVIIPTAGQRVKTEEGGGVDSKKPTSIPTAATNNIAASSANANANANAIVPPEYRLVRPTFDGTNLTTGLAPQDVPRRADSLRVAPYVSDMFQHFYAAETDDAPGEYMDDQPDINAKMRAILIDWLVEVHMKFRLVPETLYLCVNLIDRYCQLVDIKRSELQLVGVTALLIACKYEEIYPPEVRDCVYITDRAYLRQQVLDMEQDILSKLEFRITVPTAYPFLCRYLDLIDAPKLVRHAASFYMERTLQEHDLLHYRPSLVAASAVILAMRNPSILRQLQADTEPEDEEDVHTTTNHRAWLSAHNRSGIPQVLLEYTGFSTSEIREANAIVCTKVAEEPVTASRRQLVAVKRKWDNAKFRHISTQFDLPLPSHVGV